MIVLTHREIYHFKNTWEEMIVYFSLQTLNEYEYEYYNDFQKVFYIIYKSPSKNMRTSKQSLHKVLI